MTTATPHGKGVVCYEASKWAPWGPNVAGSGNYTFGYLEYMLKTKTDPRGGATATMYAEARIDWTRTCSERGFNYNKIVHCCFQHGYAAFSEQYMVDKYSVYRQKKLAW